jgi:hypothetical protein
MSDQVDPKSNMRDWKRSTQVATSPLRQQNALALAGNPPHSIRLPIGLGLFNALFRAGHEVPPYEALCAQWRPTQHPALHRDGIVKAILSTGMSFRLTAVSRYNMMTII